MEGGKVTQARRPVNVPHLGVHVIDTADANDKHDLGFWGDVEAILGLCLALQADKVCLLCAKLTGPSVMQADITYKAPTNI